MKTKSKVSTKFISESNRHSIKTLVSIGADKPPVRAPINVALVLDRSGSMDGEPLHEAKAAALKFVSYLSKDDRLSIVTFDSLVETAFGPGSATHEDVEASINSIYSRGMTNLSGGWMKGKQHVASGKVDGTNRVVLFTDGLANEGIVDHEQIEAMIGGATDNNISTTCIGFGPQFDENLLENAAKVGKGNFWYVESADQMKMVFDEEIEGLVSLAGQNVEVTVELLHPAIEGVSFPQGYTVEQLESTIFRIGLGDLVATRELSLAVQFHIDDVADLKSEEIARVTITADLIGDGRIEHRTVKMPIVADLDREDHVVPEIESTFTKFEVAAARIEAISEADRGDYSSASSKLRSAKELLVHYIDEPGVREEMEDLEAEAGKLKGGLFDAADRKYHAALAMSRREGKSGYFGKLRRKRGKN